VQRHAGILLIKGRGASRVGPGERFAAAQAGGFDPEV